MANWCVGTLKIRGKKENIINFIFNGLDVLKSSSAIQKIQTNDNGYIYFKGYAYIKGTNRGFIKYINVYLNYLKGDNAIVSLDTAFAWGIDVDGLVKISEQYDLDFKIFGFEKDTEFNQDVEIIKGKIIKNTTIKFRDYEWECTNPNLGG